MFYILYLIYVIYENLITVFEYFHNNNFVKERYNILLFIVVMHLKTMCENLCRICAKDIKGRGALELFKRENKILLLKIKDLTGVKLKDNLGLPNLICSDCNSDLLEAYKFREEFLKVQASFKTHVTRGVKKQKSDRLIKETEFVQVLIVKEEKNVMTSDNERTFEGEKEINFSKKEILSLKETNALELKPCEENTLEDTKNAIEKKIKQIGDKQGYNADETEVFSDLDEEGIRASDEEYSPTGDKKALFRKPKFNRRENIKIRSNGREINESKGDIVKPRKKRKDPKETPKLFICDQCGNHFTCRHHFKLHLRRHSGDKRCACELCPDKFFTSSELRRHMRRHTGERPFACKFCERRFTDYSTRIKHERTHTNERPFMCSQCGKSFTTSYILKNHMLTHTGERHFKCDVCNKAFTRRTHLVVHFRSIMHKQAVEKDNHHESQEESKTIITQQQTVSAVLA